MKVILSHGGSVEISGSQAEEASLFFIKRALAKGTSLFPYIASLEQLQRSENEAIRKEALRLALLASLQSKQRFQVND